MKRFLGIILLLLCVSGCEEPSFAQASDLALLAIGKTFDIAAKTTVDAEKLLSTHFVGKSREEVRRFLSSVPAGTDGFTIKVSAYPEFDMLRFKRRVKEGEMAARVVFAYDSFDHVAKCSVGLEFK